MALNLVPMGTYADVTGVVDATAASEIDALIDLLLAYVPDVATQDPSPTGEAPNYDKWHPEVAVHIRAEIEAIRDAVAAAPVS